MPQATRIISKLASRLPWLTITPFGAEVEPEVYCRKAMSPRRGWCGKTRSRPGSSEISIDRDPLQPCCGNRSTQIAAGAAQHIGGGEGKPRPAIGYDGAARVAPALAAGQHHRNRDDPGIKTAKKSDQAVYAHWKKQQRPISGRRATSESARQHGGTPVEFGEADCCHFAAAIGQQHIGAVLRLRGGAHSKKIGERGRFDAAGLSVSRRHCPPHRARQ